MKVRSIQSHQVLSPKTRVNFEVDARSLPNVDQVELKGSFNPETGLFDPKWNEGKALPMRDDGKGGDQKAGDGIYTAQVDLSGANGNDFWWGAQDGQGRYLRTTEHDPKVTLSGQEEMRTRMAPLTLNHYGLQENDGKASVTAWSTGGPPPPAASSSCFRSGRGWGIF